MEVTKNQPDVHFFQIPGQSMLPSELSYAFSAHQNIHLFEKLQIAEYIIESKFSKPAHCLLDPGG